MPRTLLLPTDSPPIWRIPSRPFPRILSTLGPFFRANVAEIALEHHGRPRRMGWVEVPPFGTLALAMRLPTRLTRFEGDFPVVRPDLRPTFGVDHLLVGHATGVNVPLPHHWMARPAAAHRAWIQRTLWVRTLYPVTGPLNPPRQPESRTIHVDCSGETHAITWGTDTIETVHDQTAFEFGLSLGAPAHIPCEAAYRAFHLLEMPPDPWQIDFTRLLLAGWYGTLRTLGWRTTAVRRAA